MTLLALADVAWVDLDLAAPRPVAHLVHLAALPAQHPAAYPAVGGRAFHAFDALALAVREAH